MHCQVRTGYQKAYRTFYLKGAKTYLNSQNRGVIAGILMKKPKGQKTNVKFNKKHASKYNKFNYGNWSLK